MKGARNLISDKIFNGRDKYQMAFGAYFCKTKIWPAPFLCCKKLSNSSHCYPCLGELFEPSRGTQKAVFNKHKTNFQRWPEIFFMSFFQDIVCVRSVSCKLFLIRILVVRQFSHAQFILWNLTTRWILNSVIKFLMVEIPRPVISLSLSCQYPQISGWCILKFTRQPGGQPDMVWCYSGLQI